MFWNQSEARAPGIGELPIIPFLLHGVTRVLYASRCLLRIVAGGYDDLPLQQTRIRITRRRGAARPGVGAEVVMIAPGGHEQSARITPNHFVEAECVVIERLGALDVVDVEVDVAKHRSRGHTRPALATR